MGEGAQTYSSVILTVKLRNFEEPYLGFLRNTLRIYQYFKELFPVVI